MATQPTPTTPGKTAVTTPTKYTFIPEHQLVNPKCSDIYETMNPKMNCSYNNQTQILTISNAFDHDVDPQTKMTFAVSGFRNPYNGKSVTDYMFAIADENDGLIETNEGVGLYYSAYAFGKFARAKLSRADNQT